MYCVNNMSMKYNATISYTIGKLTKRITYQVKSKMLNFFEPIPIAEFYAMSN